MEKEAKTYGRAYAFFDCRASKAEIEAELPKIRQCVKTPSNLELTLTEGPCKFLGTRILNTPRDIPELRHYIQEAKASKMKYVLEAKYEGATNKQTADELAAVLNQAYQSPLYADKEEFREAIIYQNHLGGYVFRE